MSNYDRMQQILSYIKSHQKASVKELAETFFVSEATVRRDLNELRKNGQAERMHGGAVFVEKTDEVSMTVRRIKNVKEKERVALITLRNLPEFQTVFIDNSSTCLALAERLNLTHKTVVTNGIQIAAQITRRDNVTVVMPGGEVKFNTNAMLGSLTISSMRNFRFDLALCSCTALDQNGSYESSIDTTELKRLAISHSKHVLLLVDSTKIDKNAAFRTATLSEYDMIITDAADEALKNIRAGNPALKILNA